MKKSTTSIFNMHNLFAVIIGAFLATAGLYLTNQLSLGQTASINAIGQGKGKDCTPGQNTTVSCTDSNTGSTISQTLVCKADDGSPIQRLKTVTYGGCTVYEGGETTTATGSRWTIQTPPPIAPTAGNYAPVTAKMAPALCTARGGDYDTATGMCTYVPKPQIPYATTPSTNTTSSSTYTNSSSCTRAGYTWENGKCW